MKISSRETVLFLITFGVGLLGVTAYLAKPRYEEWLDLRKRQLDLKDSIEMNERLISSLKESEEAYTALSGKFHSISENEEMKVHWLSFVENIANKRDLKLLTHKVGKENNIGDFCELTIDCPKWEGSIDALVHFLFDLQQKDAMVDVQYLRIKPKDKTLRSGRFILSCAYMQKE